MNIAVIGASGGIGLAFVKNFVSCNNVDAVCATFNQNRPKFYHPKIDWQALNVIQENSIRTWSESLSEIDWLINAAGVLHTPHNRPEKTVGELEPEFFLRNVSINTLPTLLLAKWARVKFKHGRPAIFATVSAKVGSIEDNRLGGWYSYRASKAALNMCIKTLAIEWGRILPNVTVAALHPGTTDTALSRPFQKNVPEKKLFSADQSAHYLLKVLNRLTPEQTGQFWAYDGERLPW